LIDDGPVKNVAADQTPFRGTLMKILAAGIVGALFGVASVLAFLYMKPERKLYTIVSAVNVPTGIFFPNQKDCELIAPAPDKCMAVDSESALIFAVSALRDIQPECNCDCSH
jgi:hypothetical protein